MYTDNALELLKARYYGPNESQPNDVWRRVARVVANTETTDTKRDGWAGRYFELMSGLRFLPNTPTIVNAGQENRCLSACFVDSPDDTLDSIVRVGSEIPKIEASGGGIGWGLSKLRPAGDRVGDRQGACGPLRVLRWYSMAGETFTQSAVRPGAHMAQLHVSHPDIMDFIHAKDQCMKPGDLLSNVNISVQLTDEFMEAVVGDKAWPLINPRTDMMEEVEGAVRVWQAIVKSAWKTGDPGVVFMDRVDEAHPNPHLGPINSSNPCGEEFLEDGGSCNLGSINLAAYIEHGGIVRWADLERDVETAVRFLDSVVDANWFPFERQRRMNKATRRIGLGVMGWADMLAKLGIRYDSDRGITEARLTGKFIREAAHLASAKIAIEKGHIPNSSVTTIAPTGSISMIAGCSSGIEPYFSRFWTRTALWDMDGKHVTMTECPAPLREKAGWLLDQDRGDPINLDMLNDLEFLRASIGAHADMYRTSHDISPEFHVRMQAAWQENTDNGVSKTINLPAHATEEDVESAFMLAWKLSIKATTVYRDGCKSEQVLTTKSETEAEAEMMVGGCHECGGKLIAQGGCLICQGCGTTSCEV